MWIVKISKPWGFVLVWEHRCHTIPHDSCDVSAYRKEGICGRMQETVETAGVIVAMKAL